jgi:hypothetical protein
MDAGDVAQLSNRLRDIEWMVRSLDTLTLAGQRHEVVKIVGLLEGEIADGWRSADRGLQTVLAALRSEAKRLLPDVCSFAAQAEALIGMVGAAS